MTARVLAPLDIVFLDRESLPDGVVLRPFGFPHRLKLHARSAPLDVAARIADADVVITNKAKVFADSIAGARRLKLIAVAATGIDNVDLAACTARGVPVTNVRNYAINTVPEHTFALLLALRRSIVPYWRSVAAGRWQDSGQFCFFDHPIRDLAGSTIGIIGGGAIGNAVADIARAFGMQVLFAGRKGTKTVSPDRTPFAEVLARGDVITLHVPLTPETRGLIGETEFALMSHRRSILINTARGGLVDETALERALRSGRIAGAGFDVVTVEPPPADHVLMRLLKLPNFILTPHVAWASNEAIQSLADQLVGNIEAWQRGAPRNLVGCGPA
jgi:glycerate dehydrogenase